MRRQGSLLIELAVALLLITGMAYGIAQYRWQTVMQQKEAVMRLRALQIITNFLEQSREQGLSSNGHRQIGGIHLSWLVEHAWHPLFDHDPYGARSLLGSRVSVRAEYEVPFLPASSQKRRVVVCTVMPQKTGSP